MNLRRSVLVGLVISSVFASAAGAQKNKAQGTDDGPLTYSLVGDVPKIEEMTIVVPTTLMRVTVEGDAWSVSGGGMLSNAPAAKAHAKYVVTGVDKAFIQDLAKKAQDDLVQRLTAAGFTVKTYADVKDHAEIVGHGREKVDADYGMPTDGVNGVTYAIGAPGDDQVMSGGLRTFVWSMRKVAAGLGALVIVPQYNFASPLPYAEKSSGYKRNSASIDMVPDLQMGFATFHFVNSKERGALVRQQGCCRLVAQDVGSVALVDKDKYGLGFGIKGVKANYTFAADQAAYAAGVMRAVTAFNEQMVDEMKKKMK
jgi:hypothetical protein